MNAQEYFLRKSHGAFRHGVDVTGKGPGPQIFEKFIAENPRLIQVVYVVIAEMDAGNIVDQVFQPGDNSIAAVERIAPVIPVKHAVLLVFAF